MNEYKWNNEDQTSVQKYPSTTIVENGYGWEDFQQYLAAGGQVDPWIDKQGAMDLRIDGLEAYTVTKEKEPFFYAPKGMHFFLDHDLATKAKARGADKETPWKSSDKDPDGVKRKTVNFSKQELSAFADTIIDRGEQLLGVKFFHENAIQDLYLDGTKTYQDILDYDFTMGWPE